MTDVAASKENPLAGVASPKRERFNGFTTDDEKQHVMSTIEHMHNHRRLTGRQIQLLAIAGTIGELSSSSIYPNFPASVNPCLARQSVFGDSGIAMYEQHH